MTENRDYFYYDFKLTKKLCNALAIEYDVSLENNEDKIIEFLEFNTEELVKISAKNNDIIKYIIQLYSNSNNKIKTKSLENFLNIIKSNEPNLEKIVEFESFKIFHDSFFTNHKASNIFYRYLEKYPNFSHNIEQDFQEDLESLDFDLFIEKYKIIKGSNLYAFLKIYKTLFSVKDCKEDDLKIFFDNQVKTNLPFLKYYVSILANLIIIFGNSENYKNYITTIIEYVEDDKKEQILDKIIKTNLITNSNLEFITKSFKKGNLIAFFKEKNDRTKFWSEYLKYIEDIEILNFKKSKIVYIIYFKNIVFVEFYPVGSAYIYSKEDFKLIKNRKIYYIEQLKEYNRAKVVLKHNNGWQTKFRNYLKINIIEEDQ